MIVEVNLVFSGEELCAPFIAETFMRGSKPTQTFRGKRLFKEFFPTKEEQDKCLSIVTRAKQWYSHSKFPREIKMDAEEYAVWKKTLEYCRRVA